MFFFILAFALKTSDVTGHKVSLGPAGPISKPQRASIKIVHRLDIYLDALEITFHRQFSILLANSRKRTDTGTKVCGLKS